MGNLVDAHRHSLDLTFKLVDKKFNVRMSIGPYVN